MPFVIHFTHLFLPHATYLYLAGLMLWVCSFARRRASQTYLLLPNASALSMCAKFAYMWTTALLVRWGVSWIEHPPPLNEICCHSSEIPEVFLVMKYFLESLDSNHGDQVCPCEFGAERLRERRAFRRCRWRSTKLYYLEEEEGFFVILYVYWSSPAIPLFSHVQTSSNLATSCCTSTKIGE